MNDSSHANPASETNTDQRDIAAGRTRVTLASIATGALLRLALLSPTAARAVDGCLVLLCFTAPSWRAIPPCVGSQQAGYFEGGGYATVRVLVLALAMELHRWLQQSSRKDLLRQSHITDAEIELLRREAAGQSSKVIGASLKVEATTIDCRFQRLNAKLDAPDRRTALRIARLYGLL